MVHTPGVYIFCRFCGSNGPTHRAGGSNPSGTAFETDCDLVAGNDHRNTAPAVRQLQHLFQFLRLSDHINELVTFKGLPGPQGVRSTHFTIDNGFGGHLILLSGCAVVD